jgi:hypothetical protein
MVKTIHGFEDKIIGHQIEKQVVSSIIFSICPQFMIGWEI